MADVNQTQDPDVQSTPSPFKCNGLRSDGSSLEDELMKLAMSRAGKLAALVAVASLTVSGALGCVISTQARVEEVVRDYSDADFYDRPFAAEPRYADTDIYEEYRAEAYPCERISDPQADTLPPAQIVYTPAIILQTPPAAKQPRKTDRTR
jgi:hypothetical protein